METDRSRKKLSGLHVRPLLIISVVVLLLTRTFFLSRYKYQLMLIWGESMKPAYRHLQLVLIDRQPGELAGGDVIAFRSESAGGVLVKRIAACPGDRIVIREGRMYVNGELSAFGGETPPSGLEAGVLGKEKTLPGGEEYAEDAGGAQGGEEESGSDITAAYAVIGDNFPHSIDSRDPAVGLIPETEILGKVIPQKKRTSMDEEK